MPNCLRRALGLLAYAAEKMFDYDGEATQTPPEEGAAHGDTGVPDLDEIDPEIVCQFKVKTCLKRVQERGLTVLEAALSMLQPDDDHRQAPEWARRIQQGHQTKPQTRQRRIGAKYAKHIKQLRGRVKGDERAMAGRQTRPQRTPPRPDAKEEAKEEQGKSVLRVVKYGISWFCSGYFAVLKTANVARSIFSGRRLSRECPVPPPVNLADTRDVVRKMRNFLRKQRREKGRAQLYAYGGDFRHWFHQIPAAPWMRNLFGLVDADNNEYQWQSLPMGWSWSPFLAQACAWSVLTRDHAGKNVFDVEAFRSNRLPTWIEVRGPDNKVVGYATVYYDNFLVFSSDANVMDAARKQIKNACREAHAVIKDGSEFSVTPASFNADGFDFLGIHFQGRHEQEAMRDPARKGPPKTQCDVLLWRPTKISKWRLKHDTSPGGRSARTMAQLAGNCIFALLMSPAGLQRCPEGRSVIGVTRAIGRFVHGDQSAWSRMWESAEEEMSLLKVWAHVQTLEEEPFASHLDADEPGFDEPKREHFVATDASSTGLGWCWWAQDERVKGPGEHLCGGRPVETNEHIFFLELRAAIEGMEAWCKTVDATARATLIVDNSALAFALRHGVSSNQKATELMEKAERTLARVEDVILVVSADNPSDCCSRRFGSKMGRAHDDFSERTEAMWKSVACRERGWNWASEKAKVFIHEEEEMKRNLRHHMDFPDETGILNEENEWELLEHEK